MRHHAIIVAGFEGPRVLAAYDEACHIFSGVLAIRVFITPPSRTPVNDYTAFAVLPDGSDEGYDESDASDRARAAFIDYLRRQVYEDGSSKLEWCEVQFGDENDENRMLAASGGLSHGRS